MYAVRKAICVGRSATGRREGSSHPSIRFSDQSSEWHSGFREIHELDESGRRRIGSRPIRLIRGSSIGRLPTRFWPQMAQICADDVELESANICGICGEPPPCKHESQQPGSSSAEAYGFLISVGFLDGCPRIAPPPLDVPYTHSNLNVQLASTANALFFRVRGS
jgi:hypothetical protein